MKRIMVFSIVLIAVIGIGLALFPMSTSAQRYVNTGLQFLSQILPGGENAIVDRQIVVIPYWKFASDTLGIDSVSAHTTRTANDSLGKHFARWYSNLWVAPYNARIMKVTAVCSRNDSDLVIQLYRHGIGRTLQYPDSVNMRQLARVDSLTKMNSGRAPSDSFRTIKPDTAGDVMSWRGLVLDEYVPQYDAIGIKVQSARVWNVGQIALNMSSIGRSAYFHSARICSLTVIMEVQYSR